ncbi:interleukin-13 receptor subunit alpha-1 [Pungitius pungitius]|uniref:interleukin-13 receptor subunit alpha-1 n=1 Tax=Pungitius pungitius TaxID=134920 RepID=UPI002E16886F
MARTRLSLDLLVCCCFFLTVGSQRAPVSPPRDVSLVWINEFWAQLSWAPPPHSMANCHYEVIGEIHLGEKLFHSKNVNTQYFKRKIVMEGGFLQLRVQTTCSGIHSEPVVMILKYPDLVRNVHCYSFAATKGHCSWSPASQAPDLRFFYWLVDDYSEPPADETSVNIQECLSYNYTGAVRTGCNLEARTDQIIYIFFNATLMDTVPRNTFKKETFEDVRPPPLEWTVNKTGDKFAISWTKPDIPIDWSIIMRYTECDETKNKTFQGDKPGELDLVPHCPYCMALIAHFVNGATPWTKEKCFDADIDPKAWMLAAIIIPLMLVGLLALMFGCYRKNKEYIFPKVPQPRDLLSDISDNNNKSTVPDLYIPMDEEANCKITLVEDPLINT